MEDKLELQGLIGELAELKAKHFDSAIDWYQTHSKTPRLLYRLTGYVLITLSVTVPFLSTVKFYGSEVLLSFVAILIAALTGINSFAQWDSRWQGYKRAQVALENLEAIWDIQILEAKRGGDLEEAQRAVMDATRKLFDDAKRIITSETEKYFEDIRIVQTQKK